MGTGVGLPFNRGFPLFRHIGPGCPPLVGTSGHWCVLTEFAVSLGLSDPSRTLPVSSVSRDSNSHVKLFSSIDTGFVNILLLQG